VDGVDTNLFYTSNKNHTVHINSHGFSPEAKFELALYNSSGLVVVLASDFNLTNPDINIYIPWDISYGTDYYFNISSYQSNEFTLGWFDQSFSSGEFTIAAGMKINGLFFFVFISFFLFSWFELSHHDIVT